MAYLDNVKYILLQIQTLFWGAFLGFTGSAGGWCATSPNFTSSVWQEVWFKNQGNLEQNKSSYHFQYLNCCQILYYNTTDLKLGSFYLVFSALFISGIHKVPGLKSNGGWVTWSAPAKGLLDYSFVTLFWSDRTLYISKIIEIQNYLKNVHHISFQATLKWKSGKYSFAFLAPVRPSVRSVVLAADHHVIINPSSYCSAILPRVLSTVGTK